MIEVNFDGLVGPTHNYAGLSLGNIASATNAGSASAPRQAALQGLAKMRRMRDMGFVQGILLPHERPDVQWLRTLGFSGDDEAVCREAWRAEPALLRNASSASSMWTANAATVTPGPDSADGQTHLSVANLASMPHRSLEAAQTARQLRKAFAGVDGFVVHDPLPAVFGDEGAANHMRLCTQHGEAGVEIFVHGDKAAGGFPARQHPQASAALARRHAMPDERFVIARQSDEAIAAGAFHNDVVAVANERVLFTHEQAFADQQALYAEIRARFPELVIVEAPANRVSLSDAIRSYLFNSQLITLADGTMALLLPGEAREVASVTAWLDDVVASGGPIRQLLFSDLRESMRNGGGPACLRLRIAMNQSDIAAMDQRFLLDDARIGTLANVIEVHWPERIAPDDLGDPALWRQCWTARRALLSALGFEDGEL